jgi:hypothetical protein
MINAEFETRFVPVEAFSVKVHGRENWLNVIRGRKTAFAETTPVGRVAPGTFQKRHFRGSCHGRADEVEASRCKASVCSGGQISGWRDASK